MITVPRDADVRITWATAAACLLAACGASRTRGDDQTAFFENRIRPLLERACVECHSGDDASGGVRFTDRAGWADAGVVEPGRPESSRLLEVVRSEDPDERMPPPDSGQTVSASEIRDIEAWIAAGAHDPRESGKVAHKGPKLRSRVFEITAEDRAWWAFQPLTVPEFTAADATLPASNKIDLLVRRGIATLPVPEPSADPTAADGRSWAGGLPSRPATPRELVRRLFFDLWGLAPQPEAVAALAADPSDAAWARLVDETLTSCHYGERQAQHWLDWVRYAETNGYERDGDKPNAWRYRDYVIRSFASDKPYDRFLVEQIAGDEWAATPGSPAAEHDPEAWRDAIIATGFLRLHQWDDEPASSDQAELDDADDVLVTLSSAFLGLTVGCARCHDHKYDPLSQRDYYSLLSFLRGIDPYGRPKKGGGGRGTGQIEQIIGATPDATPRQERALAAVELPQPKATFVLHRGDRSSPREEVQPLPPEILRVRGTEFPAIAPVAGSSGRRLALARWLVDPRHPLTARVLANRIWQLHFGTAIVPSPDDFGRTGIPPSNRPLLDFLASELIESGWSVRHLHRIILGSHAYRMTSRAQHPSLAAIDPENRFFWRQSIRRMDAEAIRDTLLAINGHLGDKRSGPSVFPALSAEVRSADNPASFRWPESPEGEQDCRSIYLVVKRSLAVPFLETLDRGIASTPTVVRPVTTTAPQALVFLNDPWVHRQADRLHERISREAGPDDSRKLRRLWQLALQRDPAAAEIAAAGGFLTEQAESPAAGEPAADRAAAAWRSLCRAVMTCNEAVYVE
jgi:hypothetical protein